MWAFQNHCQLRSWMNASIACLLKLWNSYGIHLLCLWTGVYCGTWHFCKWGSWLRLLASPRECRSVRRSRSSSPARSSPPRSRSCLGLRDRWKHHEETAGNVLASITFFKHKGQKPALSFSDKKRIISPFSAAGVVAADVPSCATSMLSMFQVKDWKRQWKSNYNLQTCSFSVSRYIKI